jgi:hypothetical protein
MSEDVAYCVNGCGVPAVGEVPVGDDVLVLAAGGVYDPAEMAEEAVELVCARCLGDR